MDSLRAVIIRTFEGGELIIGECDLLETAGPGRSP
jgi:hypothetical protein